MNRKQTGFFSKRLQEQEKTRFGYHSTYLSLLGIIAFLFIYYVVSLNTSATLGYDIRELENSQRELKIELDRLNVQIAEIESLDTIINDEVYDMMIPSDEPDYVVIKSDVQYVYNN